MFSTLLKPNFNLWFTFKLSSVNTSNLDRSKILSFGKELKKRRTFQHKEEPSSKWNFSNLTVFAKHKFNLYQMESNWKHSPFSILLYSLANNPDFLQTFWKTLQEKEKMPEQSFSLFQTIFSTNPKTNLKYFRSIYFLSAITFNLDQS